MRVINVVKLVLVTTRVAIDIVPNVRKKTEKIGYKLDKANSYQFHTLLMFFYLFFIGILDLLRLIHVVFTLHDSINSLAMQEPRLVYDILFECTWETLKTFGKAAAIQSGIIAVLHTLAPLEI
ncbi:hypothetical protein RCH19_002776 [Flavobacterium sp. PL12]